MSVFTLQTFLIIYSGLLLQSHSAGDFYFAEVPKTVTAPVGSCLQIPCTFNIPGFNLKLKETRHIRGVWMKNPTVEATQCGQNCVTVFNSSNNIIRGSSEIQMIGNLSERNCTTVFYNITKSQTGTYFFRLEMKSFKGTFNTLVKNPDITKFKPVKIKVTDSPSRPKLQLMGGEETVMEGSTVTLRCSAKASCPQVSWSNVPESADVKPQRLETKPDGTQWVFSEVTFTASHVDHQANVSCTVTYPRATSTETVTLRVSFPPKETRVSISPSASVSVGSEVTLTCESKTTPSNFWSFSWFRSDREEPLEHGKIFRFTATQSDAGLYLCVAANQHGHQSSAPVLLTVTAKYTFPVAFGRTVGVLAFILFSLLCIFLTRKKSSSGEQTGDKHSDDVTEANE